ncbi:MAG: VWA domain-containing protein [Deltaproteobacteria bacterium]|nr:VWA domain-containing protein [Deltaproteobacteria bacterium]
MPYLLVAIACAAILGLFAGALVLASLRRARATKQYGDPVLVGKLESFNAAGRRALKGVLLVAALLFAFLALGRPQWGRGQKLIPATNLDVVIVLDYSKSMYARDIAPSRIARAKAEVAKLVRDLPGARFGAVAFAGEPMSFPMTSDSAAIAQFFRQLEPNDMPVGGTAIAKALERARELMARDPKSKEHMRVIVLVTDGEDLEGDPVGVARSAAAEKTRIDVVQIGGRAPEPIPEVTADGKVNGVRRDDEGKPLTTELTADGEAQLAEIAKLTGGAIVRADRGETGIDEVARGLKRLMREELAERVETAFDEEYMWPLGLAVVLLVIEGVVPEAPLPRLPSGVMTLTMGAAPGRRRRERDTSDKKDRGDKGERGERKKKSRSSLGRQKKERARA